MKSGVDCVVSRAAPSTTNSVASDQARSLATAASRRSTVTLMIVGRAPGRRRPPRGQRPARGGPGDDDGHGATPVGIGRHRRGVLRRELAEVCEHDARDLRVDERVRLVAPASRCFMSCHIAGVITRSPCGAHV